MKNIHLRIKEKWNEAGFQKYFRNTGWVLISRVIGMGIAFFVTAIVARYLGPDKYGTLMYAVSFVGLFSFIASLGIDQILYRELIKSPEREDELFGTALGIKIFGGILALLATFAASFFFTENPLEQKLILIISLSFIFQSFGIISYIFQARLENKKLSLITIIATVLLSAFKIGIVYANKGILFLSAVLVLEPIIYAAFFIFYYSKFFGNIRKWKFSTQLAKNILRDSLPLLFSTVFALIYSRIDQVMLKGFIDSTAVGLYNSAVSLSEVWYFIPTVIVSTLFPSIMNSKLNDQHIYGKRILKLTALLISISAFIALVGTLFAKPILNLVYGAEFLGAQRALQFYLWSGVGISISTVLIQFLIAEKLSSIILYISIAGMTLNVVLNFLLIPQFGINGSALATLLSYIIGPLTVLCFKEPRKRINDILSS